MNRIDVSKILRDHLDTFRSQPGGISISDVIIFLLIPLISSASFLFFDLSKASPNVISVMSIFAGLLLNLLVLIFDVSGKTSSLIGAKVADLSLEQEEEISKSRVRLRLLKSIYNNISYSILIAALSVFVLIPFSLDFSISLSNTLLFKVTRVLFGLLSIFLIVHFLMNILMVLRRIHSLLSKDIGKSI